MERAPRAGRGSGLPKMLWIALLLVVAGLLARSLRVSGGVWHFRSAPVPEGWPPLTPVGEVRVQRYPPYRAAFVSEAALADGDQSSMFMALFRHIRADGIAMTAPVEMGHRDGPDVHRMDSMGFLYRVPELGPTGARGAVEVRDVPQRTCASVGVRGAYSEDNFRAGLARLEAWLAEEDVGWAAAGPPRYLGYNGPFVLPFLRYGEVQVPVAPRR